MKAGAAPQFVRTDASASDDSDIAYYIRRVGEERLLAVTATSDVARAAHRMLALIYEDHLRALSRDAA